MTDLKKWLNENGGIVLIYLLWHIPIIYMPFNSIWDLVINLVFLEVWIISLFITIATMRYKIEKKFEKKLESYEIKSCYPSFIDKLNLEEK